MEVYDKFTHRIFNFLKVFNLKFRETILVSIQRVSVKRNTTDSCTIVALAE